MPARVCFFSAARVARTAGHRRAQRPGGDLLAAADHGGIGDGGGVEGGRGEDPPQGALEGQRLVEVAPRRRVLGRREPEFPRHGEAGQPPARKRHARPADRRPVADGEDAGDGTAALGIRHRLQPADLGPRPLGR